MPDFGTGSCALCFDRIEPAPEPINCTLAVLGRTLAVFEVCGLPVSASRDLEFQGCFPKTTVLGKYQS
jgi:hypothetical protein